ncbi:MAG: NADH-quinone oxidoreductase subunit NuoH [Candidatus Aquicultorales bacterium]
MSLALFATMLGWALGLLGFMALNAFFIIYLERKLLGHIHRRYGPMHTGPHGALQMIADGLKMILKEDVIPGAANKLFFWLAPIVVVVPAYLVYMTLPFQNGLAMADLGLGVFFVFAVTAMMPIGFTLAGWASHNKYSLLGALRAAAQQISYEVPLLLSVLGVVMMAGSMQFSEIVEKQQYVWYAFKQPLGFVLLVVAALAEANRTPFDMPEAGSELVAGYQTEFSGMKWGLFMLAEYSSLLVSGLLVSLLFLGGWNMPFLPDSFVWLLLKAYLFIFFVIWVRGTLPRIRVDIMMELGWKIMIPVGLANLMLAGLLSALWPQYF